MKNGINIGKLKFGIGWYTGEEFALLNLKIFEIHNHTYSEDLWISVLWLQIAFLCIDITWN